VVVEVELEVWKVAEWTGNIREKRKYGRIAAGEATRFDRNRAPR
jgi:hypothetical protein